MQGRRENEIKMEKKIGRILENQPNYMNRYYYTIKDKSYTTQHKYILYVISFIDYVREVEKTSTCNLDCFICLKTSFISMYIHTLNCSNSQKRCKFYAIKSFYDFLESDGYIDINPCNKVKIPKQEEDKEVVFLTKPEIKRIKTNFFLAISRCGECKMKVRWINRDWTIMMLALSLGLRVTSLTEINIEDLDLEKKELRLVTKGNKFRVLEFGENVKELLQSWIEDREVILKENGIKLDCLFFSRKFNRISRDSIEDMIKVYTRGINKHITPHKLRSSCATIIYNETGDIYLVAYVLGHSNIRNTKKYTNVGSDRKEKAAKAMDKILF